MPTTTFDFTDCSYSGQFLDSSGLFTFRRFDGLGSRADLVVTGTALDLSCYASAANSVEASVDGGAWYDVTPSSLNTYAYFPVFSGLSDAAHAVAVRTKNPNPFYFDRGTNLAFRVTGASPACTADPTQSGGTQYVLNATAADTLGRAGVLSALATEAGYLPYTGPGGAISGYPLLIPTNATLGSDGSWSQANYGAQVRFKATASRVDVWTLLDGSKFALVVDGVVGASRSTPSRVAAVTGVALASDVATLTTASPHGYAPGASVTVSGLSAAAFNGIYAVTSAPTATTFAFALTGADVAQTADSGIAEGHEWGWFTVGEGLDAGAEHTYGVANTAYEPVNSGIGAAGLFAVRTFGGTGLNAASAPAARPLLVGFGDSITANQLQFKTVSENGLGNYDAARKWLLPLAEKLGCQFTNAGISATTVKDFTGNLGTLAGSQNLVTTLSGQKRASHDVASLASPAPSKVVVLYGTNDLGEVLVDQGRPSESVSDFQAAYASMLGTLLSGLPGTAQIYAVGILPRSDFTASQISPWNAAVQAAITANGSPSNVTFLDSTGWSFNGSGSDYTTNYLDGLHPNGPGAALFAGKVYVDITAGTWAVPVETPYHSIASGPFASGTTLTLATQTAGASIRYTTDGSTPSSTAGTAYSGAVTLPPGATTVVRAVAYKSGTPDSAVTHETYTVAAASDSAAASATVGNVTASAAATPGAVAAAAASLGAVTPSASATPSSAAGSVAASVSVGPVAASAAASPGTKASAATAVGAVGASAAATPSAPGSASASASVTVGALAASASATPGGSGLTIGPASASPSAGSATVTWPAAQGGSGAKTYAVSKAPDNNGGSAPVAGWTTLASGLPLLTLSDFQAVRGTRYWYRVTVTDAASASATTAAVPADVPAAPVFRRPVNAPLGTALAADHLAGSGTLAVASAAGFGSPSPASPVRVTVNAADGSVVAVCNVTNVSGNTLTVSAFLEGTSDALIPAGTTVGVNVTAGDVTDLQDALAPLSPPVGLRPDGSWQPPHLSDAAAARDSTYYSTDAGKLTYKDPAGTPNRLY